VAQIVDDSLEAGRDAARRRAWRNAYDLLRSADESRGLAGEDIQRLAEAAWWTGRLDEAIALRERAYTAYVEEEEKVRAAMLAVMLTMDHLVRGAMSVASGWLARAERLLANEDESAAQGHLALARGIHAFDLGELSKAGEEIARARQLGARFGDRNLESMALVFEGTVLVSTGDVEQGLALLDEATAAAVSAIRWRPGSSTASPSTPARRSATAGAPRNGPKRPTDGATGWT
jgi:tetratricopeptide (TPR) repeat protein